MDDYTDEQIDAAIQAWFEMPYTGDAEDEEHRRRMRAALAAAHEKGK